ncbi:MAG TPA: phosphomethylpyrimidine synthase ThiC, partial [Thermoplasmata archaeon]|nr:phosphomethylpyrimidine synthase ThiC [Thermoplasmata archaeon]
MKGICEREGVEPDRIAKLVRDGRVVIPANPRHAGLEPQAIGEGMTVKVNANIGTSKDLIDPEEELEKLRTALRYGADAVMDLSTGGDLR